MLHLSFYNYDYLKTNIYFEFSLLASLYYLDTPQWFVDIVKVTYPWYKCDFAPKLTVIIPHVIIVCIYGRSKKKVFW